MKKLALVLSGGAARGYAHIGIIKVLEENGIVPDLIVGTSMGALVGGIYSTGKSSIELEKLALSCEKLGSFSLGSAIFKDSMLNFNKAKKLIYNAIGESLHEESKIPFIAVATDLENGKEHHFKTGKIFESIMSSIAIPGILPRMKVGEKYYNDGGLLNNLPEDVALNNLPEAVVLSVDVMGEYENARETNKFKVLEIYLNTASLMMRKIVECKQNLADLRIEVPLKGVSQMDFSNEAVISTIAIGEQVMRENIKKLKKMLKE